MAASGAGPGGRPGTGGGSGAGGGGGDRAGGAVRPVVALAHRGAHSASAPENTLPALRAAAELGYRWVETDLRATADGVPVLAHDPTLARTAGVAVPLDARPWSELAGIALEGTATQQTAGAPGAGLLRLEEALDAVPGVHLNVDVKSADAVGPLLDLLARRPELLARLRVTSFSERRRAAVLAGLRARGLGVVASSASAPLSLVCWALARSPLPRALRVAGVRAVASAGGLDSLQLPETAVLRPLRRARTALVLRVVTPRLLDVAHGAGLQVHVWVVDDDADMHRLLDAGVDGLVTDRARLLTEVLTDRGQWPPPPEGPGHPPAPRPDRSPP